MLRFAIILVAVLVGSAAPARAWCEATCLAPSEASSGAHCPAQDAPATDPSISGSAIADCPVIESARPVPARLDLQMSDRVVVLVPSAPSHLRTFAPPHVAATTLKRLTPLRI